MTMHRHAGMERDVLRKKAQYDAQAASAAGGSRHQRRRGLGGGLRWRFHGLTKRSHSATANGNGSGSGNGGSSLHGGGGGGLGGVREVQITKREWDEAIAEALF